MNQNYEKEQKDKVQRKINSIWAAKVLSIDGNNLIVRRNFKDDTTIRIPVSYPEEYQVGQYVDVQIWKSGTSSYGTRYIGVTPKEFIPVDGAYLGTV